MTLYASATAVPTRTVVGGRVVTPLALIPTAPGDARHFLGDTLAEWGLDHVADTAGLIVSELVTNAVLHGAAPASLTVYTDPRADGGFLFIEVVDAGESKPEKRAAGDYAEDGRGLFIVEALAADWGVEAVEGGKRIWASISLGPDATEAS